MVYSGKLFILFCTVDWLGVQGLNIEAIELGVQPLCVPFYFNYCFSLTLLLLDLLHNE